MVWDLRGALLKKEEFESARLANFEFRQRARAMRLLAPLIGADAEALVVEIAERDDVAILAGLAERLGIAAEELHRLHGDCWTQARAQLIGEIGDPTPHRLG